MNPTEKEQDPVRPELKIKFEVEKQEPGLVNPDCSPVRLRRAHATHWTKKD
jgi:hypothetical protein